MRGSWRRFAMAFFVFGGLPVSSKTSKNQARTDDEIRDLILKYLYERNRNATSRRGKSTGAAVTISILRADLKAGHGPSVQRIHSNLTYLESQGWVEDSPVTKSVPTRSAR